MKRASLNHTYRLVWSDIAKAFVAVSETTKAKGKNSRAGRSLAAAVSAMFMSGAVLAADLPTGGQIVGGAGSISQSGSVMTINQSSAKMAADWQSFNIGAGNTVNFVQPSASSVALNRVLGSDVSVIQGALNANGQVFLINPNGVLFTPAAQVNVGGIVASTLNMSTADFMAGSYKFEGSSSNAIINQGNITAANGGTIALIAAKITNTGTLTANQGNVLLGAGSKVTLDLGGPVKLQVEQAAIDALIESGGAIKADGGLVYLTAKAAGDLASSVINNTGLIEAHSLSANEKGEIVLESGYAIIHTGTLDVSGVDGGQITLKTHNLIDAGTTLANGQSQGGSIRIDATGRVLQTTAATLQANGGKGAGGTIRIQANESAWLSGSLQATGHSGGDISLTAPELTLTETQLNASGETAGGRIRAGGGWQGKDTDLANAQRTRVVATEMDVSATQNGNGGIAVVWSEAETLFGGRIAARGGADGGNGGQVEISSHDKLSFAGLVDASAPNGTNGSLLLDPKNIDIVASVSGFNLLSLPDPTPSAGEVFGTNRSVIELRNNGVSTDRIVVASRLDDFAATDAGAVYLYNSQTGALISTLVGSKAGDNVGGGVTALSNGNYVVSSSVWDRGSIVDAGAATWGNGSTGISGAVSATNSLVGSKAGDQMGSDGITALSNGNYVVSSSLWDNGSIVDAGAATWGNGSTGISGAVSSANSLVGSQVNDWVGNSGITALSNGNYVVGSKNWDKGSIVDAGAATWGNGSTGISGAVSTSNSLVGSTAGEVVGDIIIALTNGNYVASAIYWDNGSIADVGALTWGNGSTTGTRLIGTISAANSLVGSSVNEYIGNNITVLSNGNYVVRSVFWGGGVGAVIWGNGAGGTVGVMSASNSLVGSTANDNVGSNDVVALSNGNYVVSSSRWNNGSIVDAGAVTWGDGSTTGTRLIGTISAANSLVGSTASDNVGNLGVTALTNGNYVVNSSLWNNGSIADAGAVTWGDGSTGISGAVSSANSLVGSTASENVGNLGVTALTNGNYVVSSSLWNNAANVADVGAVTWGDGSTTGTRLIGTISATNSLVGSATSDKVGGNGVTALTNGNYVVRSSLWDNGTTSDAGAVTWGDGSAGISGEVSSANSLVGSTMSDQVGNLGVTALTNGNYVVRSSVWDNAGVTNVGAVTWGNGSTGISGALSATNSLVGSTANDNVGSGQAIALADGRFLIGSPNWDRTTPSLLSNAGRVDILSTAVGASASLPLSFSTDPSASSSLLASTLLASLNAGTAVTLQANNDITLSTALTVNNTSGNGGALTLQAGRSILLNANLTTDNGNLTLIANDTAANGVVNANRDAGAANITQAAGTTINAGTGTVSIDLRDGAGNTNNTIGTATLASVTAANLAVQSNSFSATATANNKTYDGTVAATLSAASLTGLAFQSGSNLSAVNPTTGSFADKNVANGIAVTSDQFKITGYNVGNSSNLLKSSAVLTASTTANITAAGGSGSGGGGNSGSSSPAPSQNVAIAVAQATAGSLNGNPAGGNTPGTSGLFGTGSGSFSGGSTSGSGGISLSGGLVFVDVPAESGGSSANTGSTGSSSGSPQGSTSNDGAGRDASGFIRVFVVDGGIRLHKMLNRNEDN